MILKSIKNSFLYETSRYLHLILIFWGGIFTIITCINKIHGIDLLALFIEAPVIILLGYLFVKVFSSGLLTDNSGSRIYYFNFNGQNSWVMDGTSSLKDPTGGSLIFMVIKGFISLPLYILKLCLRLIESIFSKTYREALNQLYEEDRDCFYQFTRGLNLFINLSMVVIFALSSMVVSIQQKIYSPDNIKITNAQIIKSNNNATILTFDCYSVNGRITQVKSMKDTLGIIINIECDGKLYKDYDRGGGITEISEVEQQVKIYLHGDYSEVINKDCKITLTFGKITIRGVLGYDHVEYPHGYTIKSS